MSVSISTSSIVDVIQDKLRSPEVVFVFPTDVSASSWAEWVITHPENTHVMAVSTERFIAWDEFKTTWLHEKNDTKKPATLIARKLLARDLITKAVSANVHNKPLLNVLIPPAYAKNSNDVLSFTEWIADVLPYLKFFHQKHQEWLKNSAVKDDAENSDYEVIYKSYNDFLSMNNLYEPLWADSIIADGKKFVIFYPEIIADYCYVEDLLAHNDRITTVHLPQPTDEKQEMVFFTNARTELHYVAFNIRQLCSRTENPIPCNHITVSVPDLETWRPYIEREFELYEIPYMMRAGITYDSGSGHVFREIQDCFDTKFSFASVQTLLLDKCIPWKNFECNKSLISFGVKTKSLHQYKDYKTGLVVDAWEESFNALGNRQADELKLYKTLKERVKAICLSTTFIEIRNALNQFENDLLNFAIDAVGAYQSYYHCKSELDSLVAAENKYAIKCVSPYLFFIDELSQKTYEEKNTTSGVSIVPYRLTASASFEYQFVVNVNQNDCTVSYMPLPFLNVTKREALLGLDQANKPDAASDTFIRLYAGDGTMYNGKQQTVFTGSEQTFSGFAIPYSKLQVKKNLPRCSPGSFSVITQNQFDCFCNWKNKINNPKKGTTEPEVVKDKINACVKKSIISEHTDEIYITQDDLKQYTKCPRCWVLNRALRIKEQTYKVQLFENYDKGKILHKILEQFMGNHMKGNPLPITTENGTFSNETAVMKEIESYIDKAFIDKEMSFKNSPLAKSVLEQQKDAYLKTVIDFLHSFCCTDGKGFGGSEVIAVEEEFFMAPVSQIIPNAVYYGILDAVIPTREDEITIVDYKNTSGAVPKIYKCYGKNVTEFQMLLYVKLWNANQHDINKAQNAFFYSIQDGKKHSVLSDGSTPSAEEKITSFNNTLEALDENYTQPFVEAVCKQSFNPDAAKVLPYLQCKDCDYKEICRTTYHVAGEKL